MSSQSLVFSAFPSSSLPLSKAATLTALPAGFFPAGRGTALDGFAAPAAGGLDDLPAAAAWLLWLLVGAGAGDHVVDGAITKSSSSSSPTRPARADCGGASAGHTETTEKTRKRQDTEKTKTRKGNGWEGKGRRR